jgi:transcriptional antiterminator NusG
MGVSLGETVEINLSVGDNVRIVGTAMDGFTGVVQSIDIEEGTCEVLVSMFGQETPTKLALTEVTRAD